MTYTVLGAGGSIGSRLVATLRAAGAEVFAPDREFRISPGRSLGHVLYCIGVTADFRSRSFETVDAHVGVLRRVLEQAEYSSLLYLSSTRVYRGLEKGREDAALLVRPSDPEDLYASSKLLGEALCLSLPQSTIRVARLSNVIGPGATAPAFVHSLVRDALERGSIELQSDLGSTKNYVDLRDVVDILPRIATSGRSRLYNVAGARQTTHGKIVDLIARETGCRVDVRPGAPLTLFPPISIDLVRSEFGFAPRPVDESVADMVAAVTPAPDGAPG